MITDFLDQIAIAGNLISFKNISILLQAFNVLRDTFQIYLFPKQTKSMCI